MNASDNKAPVNLFIAFRYSTFLDNSGKGHPDNAPLGEGRTR
jgi:hypothetical protein